MSKDAKPAAAEGEAPPKKSKKLLVIILAVVLLLVLGGGAAFFVLKKNHDAEDEDAEEVAKPKKKKKDAKAAHQPVFFQLDSFTVNLVPEQGDQYLQVTITLELEDAAADPAVKGIMPKIRNGATLLLSSKKASEIATKEGKEKLADELKDMVNTLIEPPKKGQAPEGPITAVLFTSFIIQ